MDSTLRSRRDKVRGHLPLLDRLRQRRALWRSRPPVRRGGRGWRRLAGRLARAARFPVLRQGARAYPRGPLELVYLRLAAGRRALPGNGGEDRRPERTPGVAVGRDAPQPLAPPPEAR